jgi:phage terminase large subunit-like protein
VSEAERYATDLLSPGNEWKSGRYMKLAAQRFLSDLKRTDIHFDEVEADRMINFGERYCCLWEDVEPETPVRFEAWQKFIFQQVYGWIRKEDGRRRVRKVYIQVAKKNSKSTTLAAVPSLFHLFADERVKTPKIFTAANNEDQARICVNIAGRMIEASPTLADMIADSRVYNPVKPIAIHEILGIVHNIHHHEKNGFIKPLSKETDDKKSKQAGGKHGINASMGVVDEYGMSPDAGATNTIESSMASRKEPLMLYITTAGFNKDGPCFQQLRKTGIEVLEGATQMDSFLPFIFELDEGDDYRDEKNWLKCNPNLGISVDQTFLRERVQRSIAEGGSTEVDVRTLNFNMWCDAPAVFIPQDVWNANTHGISEEDLLGKVCFAGLEIPHGPIGSLALIFPNIGENVHALKVFFWMPENKVIRNDLKTDFSPYRDQLTVCSGDVIENSVIYEQIREALSAYQVHSIAFTKSLETHDILQALVRDGYECNPISQGYSGISTPTIEWEKILTAKQVEHFNNPLLAWMNQQCEVVRKDNEIKLQKSGGRNVGIHASINALAQWMTVDALPDEDAGITEMSI